MSWANKMPEHLNNARLADFAFLDELGDGGLDPSYAELADAPLIQVWRLTVSLIHGDQVICGLVSGHPRVPDGPVTTTPPVAADTRRGWMKTRNTLYRLGGHI